MRCKLAHRGYVMVNGVITMSGTGRELLERPEVRAAYLEGGATSGRNACRASSTKNRRSGSSCWSPACWAAGRPGCTGRAIALTWRPADARLCVYVLLLGIAVRFIHFALFEGTLFSLHYYVVDTVVLLIIGFVGLPLPTRASR